MAIVFGVDLRIFSHHHGRKRGRSLVFYPPLPGLLTDPEPLLPDDELPLLLLLLDEGVYVLVSFDGEGLIRGKIICLPSLLVLLLLLLLYCVEGFDQVTVPLVLPEATLLL